MNINQRAYQNTREESNRSTASNNKKRANKQSHKIESQQNQLAAVMVPSVSNHPSNNQYPSLMQQSKAPMISQLVELSDHSIATYEDIIIDAIASMKLLLDPLTMPELKNNAKLIDADWRFTLNFPTMSFKSIPIYVKLSQFNCVPDECKDDLYIQSYAKGLTIDVQYYNGYNKDLRKAYEVHFRSKPMEKLCQLLAFDATVLSVKSAILECVNYIVRDRIAFETLGQFVAPLGGYEPDLKCSFDELSANGFRIIKRKKKTLFANSKYTCRYCNYQVSTVQAAISHIRTFNNHIAARQDELIQNRLLQIPAPTQLQCRSIGLAVSKLDLEHARSTDVLLACQQAANVMTNWLSNGMSLRVYGSSMTGAALNSSNCNLECILPSTITEPNLFEIFDELSATLKKHENSDVLRVHSLKSNFNTRYPNLTFKLQDSKKLLHGVVFVLTILNHDAYDISRQLHYYLNETNRSKIVRKLIHAWRYLGKICHFDEYTTGTLPPYSLDIILIHFLQQIYFLPILYEHYPNVSSETLFSQKKIEWQPAIANISANWTPLDAFSLNDDLLTGQLWLSFLKFLAIEIANSPNVIQIRTHDPVSCAEKNWKEKRYAIEDPVISRKNLNNLTRSNFEYIKYVVRSAYNYFATNPGQAEAIPYSSLNIPHEQENLNVDEQYELEDQENEKLQDESVDTDQQSATWCDNNEMEQTIEDVDNALSNRQCTNDFSLFTDDESLPTPTIVTAASLDTSGCLEIIVPDCSAKTTCSSIDNDLNTANNEFALKQDNLNDLLDLFTDEFTLDINGQQLTEPVSLDECTVTLNDIQNNRFYDIENTASAVEENDNMSSKNLTNQATNQSRHDASDYDEAAGSSSRSWNAFPDAIDEDLSNSDNTKFSNVLNNLCQPLDNIQTPVTSIESRKNKNEPSMANNKTLKFLISITMDNDVDIAQDAKTLEYIFVEKHFNMGRKPESVCQYCSKSGHIEEKCDLKIMPEVPNVRKLSKHCLKVLNRWIEFTYTNNRMHSLQREHATAITNHIRHIIQQEFYPRTIMIDIFGSTNNGFGGQFSDLDLCMRFAESEWELPQDLDQKLIINLVYAALCKSMKVCRRERRPSLIKNTLIVANAKVPIVKFTTSLVHIQNGDISLYNVLALRNTQLMQAYSEIDDRVRQLGIFLKFWAKFCGINDASKGSLSSYAYLLCLIHYLQRLKPHPILPVLQEFDHYGQRRDSSRLFPSFIVNNFETHFYTPDGDNLIKMQERARQNRATVGELWLGFLDFFTRDFNYENEVVSVRLPITKRLHKLEKAWHCRPFAIEDPFDLHHNLASPMHNSMYKYFRKALVVTRIIFGQDEFCKLVPDYLTIPPINKEREYADLFECLVRDVFTKIISKLGKAPDRHRGCYNCFDRNHLIEQCPHKTKKRMKANQQNAMVASHIAEKQGYCQKLPGPLDNKSLFNMEMQREKVLPQPMGSRMPQIPVRPIHAMSKSSVPLQLSHMQQQGFLNAMTPFSPRIPRPSLFHQQPRKQFVENCLPNQHWAFVPFLNKKKHPHIEQQLPSNKNTMNQQQHRRQQSNDQKHTSTAPNKSTHQTHSPKLSEEKSTKVNSVELPAPAIPAEIIRDKRLLSHEVVNSLSSNTNNEERSNNISKQKMRKTEILAVQQRVKRESESKPSSSSGNVDNSCIKTARHNQQTKTTQNTVKRNEQTSNNGNKNSISTVSRRQSSSRSLSDSYPQQQQPTPLPAIQSRVNTKNNAVKTSKDKSSRKK